VTALKEQLLGPTSENMTYYPQAVRELVERCREGGLGWGLQLASLTAGGPCKCMWPNLVGVGVRQTSQSPTPGAPRPLPIITAYMGGFRRGDLACY
jgi:hypothetical protein